jgi:hypothetical protein
MPRKDRPSPSALAINTAAQRMLWASQLFMTGLYTEDQIAERINELIPGSNLTGAQVKADLNYLRRQYLKLGVRNIQEIIEREIVKLDMLEAAAFENLQTDPEKRYMYAEQMLRIMKRRSNLLGLDAPKNVNIHVDKKQKPVTQLTDEELEQIAKHGKIIEVEAGNDGTYRQLPEGNSETVPDAIKFSSGELAGTTVAITEGQEVLENEVTGE